MEDLLKIPESKYFEKKIQNPTIDFMRDNTSESSLDKSITHKTINTNFSSQELSSSLEDSDRFLENLFKGKDLILNEKWDISENVQGKIVAANDIFVYVDCLIDKESKKFQHRSFPISLFKNLNDLAPNKTVLIKTKMRAGSIRVDIFPGDGIVQLELFKQKENWDSLSESKLDEKLTEW